MNLSTLPLLELEINQPPGPHKILDPQWLRSQINLSIERQQDEKTSNSLLKAARRKAEKIVRDSRYAQLKQQKKWEAESAILRRNLLDNLESEWLAKHVKCLCDEEARHRLCIDQAADFILRSLEQVLSAWFDQQPIDDTLCHRLAKLAQSMAKEGALTLRIHPEKRALMQEHFGQRFTLVEEPTFTPDRAELSSPHYCVEFSLHNHFCQLLGWLRRGNDPGGEDECQSQ